MAENDGNHVEKSLFPVLWTFLQLPHQTLVDYSTV